MEDVKIVHVKIVGGTDSDIRAMGRILGEIKEKLPYKIEFVLTNDRIEFRDAKTLIKELYELYKKEKK